MRSVGYGLWSAESRVRGAECGVRSAGALDCEVRRTAKLGQIPAASDVPLTRGWPPGGTFGTHGERACRNSLPSAEQTTVHW